MAFRSSSSRSFSSSRSSSRPAATKQYQRPQTKTVIINRNIPATQSGQAQSLGGSLAQGAAQGAGAGVGFGIANNLMGGNWEIVSALIDIHFSDFEVYIYEL